MKMSFVWQAILQGSVGFAIGAGTNDLAIRWLFATVFTRKKKAIAESVQKVVSTELMSSDKIVARLSDPNVLAAFENNIRREMDSVCDRAGSLVGGVVAGFKPLLPEIVKAEAKALGQVGAIFGDETRALVAKACASQLSRYLSRNLPQIIEETRIWNIIHNSILDLDEKELELLTRQIASRELYGITIWGGVIGAVVGVSMSVVIHFLG